LCNTSPKASNHRSVSNFIHSQFHFLKGIVNAYVEFGLDLLVFITYVTSFDRIILPSAQNRLAMLQTTIKITLSNLKTQQNEIKTRVRRELSRGIKVVPTLLCYLQQEL
jgi:hypothetical protein